MSCSRNVLGLVGHVGRNLLDDVVGAHRLVLPADRLHARSRSTTPANLSSLPIGSWIATGLPCSFGLDLLEGAREVRADAVHLVDEADARDAVLVGLAPDGLGLRLDAGDRVEHADGAVEHAQRALDLGREVHVAGRVDDVDAVVAPRAGRRGRRDRDAALLLLLHPVHDGRAFMHLTDLVGDAGVEQDALGRRRLAGIDVGHDADVATTIERNGTSH